MDLRVCSNYFSYCIISQVKNTDILMILDHELDLKVFSLTQTVFFHSYQRRMSSCGRTAQQVMSMDARDQRIK